MSPSPSPQPPPMSPQQRPASIWPLQLPPPSPSPNKRRRHRWTGGVSVTRGNATTRRMRGARGAVGDESSSSCSYATINKKEMWQRCARPLRGRWRRDRSPGGVLRNGEGGSNDDNDAETTTTTTTVAVSIESNMRSDAAAPLRQGSTTLGLHRDVVMATSAGVMSSRWRWDVTMRSGDRRCNNSGLSEEGGRGDNGGGCRKTCRERAIRSRRCDESSQDEDRVAAMMATAMSLRGQWAVDNVTSQMVGRQMMR